MCPIFSLMSNCYSNNKSTSKNGEKVWGESEPMCDMERRSQAHQNFPELFLSPRLFLEQLLEQGAQGPALLGDHLLQHKSTPSAAGSSPLWSQ